MPRGEFSSGRGPPAPVQAFLAHLDETATAWLDRRPIGMGDLTRSG